MVRNPPILSATKPQTWRPMKAQASNADSIAAPRVIGMPASLQNATRWLCGIAIGTQQKKPAAHSRMNTVRGLRPRTSSPARGSRHFGPAVAALGNSRKTRKAAGAITAAANTA